MKRKVYRVARRLKRFERCRDAVEQELFRLIAEDKKKGPAELRLVQTQRGGSTLTFFVDCDGIRSYVLRCLLRRREVRYLPEIYSFCTENNVSTPRLRGKCKGLWWRVRIGFHLLLEEFIEAEPIEDLLTKLDRRSAAVENLAKCLADLHDVTRPDYGPVPKAASGPYLAYYLKKARQKLKEIRDSVPEVPVKETQTVERFLLDEASRFNAPRFYSLIHGDPINGNVLMDKADKVTLIDLEYMHFGLYQYDLQIVRHYLLKDDVGAFQRLKRTYDLHRKNTAEESQRLDVLCRLLVLLKSLRPKTEERSGEAWRRRWTEIQSLARG